jgi:hypothetical protein
MNTKNIITALLGLTITIAGCVKKEPLVRRAQISFAPLSPNSQAVNFGFNSDLFATQVNYNTTVGTVRYTFPYYSVLPGTADIKYNNQTTNIPLASFNGKVLEDEKVYSSFYVDSVSKAKVIIVNDDLDIEEGSGYIKIRFFNFIANSPNVDVYQVGGPTTPIWSNRGFETQQTATANEKFITMPSGTYVFEVRNSATGALITTITSQVYLSDRIYTIAARGFIGGTSTQAVGGWVYPNLP